jgi:hypothetical protein
MQVGPRSLLASLPVAALLLACASCSGPKLNPVEGKVLYQGEPIRGVLVVFHPKGADDLDLTQPTGLTGPDGVFKLATGELEGAPAGEYVLTFTCNEVAAPKPGAAMSTGIPPEFTDRLKGAYANKATSKFEIEIKPGLNQLEPFQLK